MQIPKSFQLGAQTFTVHTEPNHYAKEDNLGMIRYRENVIYVQEPTPCYPESQAESAFYHELIHAIFHMCCQYELRDDEELVQRIANYLHQYMNTAVFPLNPDYIDTGQRKSPLADQHANDKTKHR